MSRETAPKKILIVEDDPALNDAFNMMLEFAGYDVQTVYNGKEAIKKLETYQPDLILLDILMPVMDGKEFLHNYEGVARQPILVLSNLDTKDDINEVIKLGAKDYMLKSSASPSNLPVAIERMIVEFDKK